MFFLILFNSIMYVESKCILGMIKEYYNNKNGFSLEVAYVSILTGICFVKNSLNIQSILYLLLYMFIVYETFVIVACIKSFYKYLKNESEYL